MRALRGATLLAIALCTAGCVKATDEQPAKVWSLAAIRDAAKSNETLGDVSSAGLVAFRGQPIPLRAPPFQTLPALQAPDVDGAPVFPAFSEGAVAAYLTTDIWYDRDPVWVQPLYIPVTAWDPTSPFSKKLAGALPVFAPGPDSSFYSPYWQVHFAVVPAGTDPGTLKSTRDVLAAASELHDGPLKLCALVPLDMAPAAESNDVPRRPVTGETVGTVKVVRGWADGAPIGVFDFGNDRFTASEDGLVDEAPIFHFAVPDASGNLQQLDLPAVAGVGALGSGATATAPNNVPRFGGLWRLYLAQLPPGAAVFVPRGMDALRAHVASEGVQAPAPDDASANDPRASQYALRVALDARCFAGDGGFPDACTWLDSQSQVEAQLPPASLHETETTLTCPLVEFLGQPVPN